MDPNVFRCFTVRRQRKFADGRPRILTCSPATGLARAFCQSGSWTGMGFSCQFWSGDLNGLEIPAGTVQCVNGANLTNAPTTDWFFVEIIRHVNGGNYYETQRATGMTGSAAGYIWIRDQQSATAGTGWGAWNKVGDTPSGTICGMMTNGGGNGALCMGYNPYFSCPPGYTQHLWNISGFGDGHFYWCFKN